jgi:hypothetical protein
MALHATLSRLPVFQVPGHSLGRWAVPLQAAQSRDCVNLPHDLAPGSERSLSRVFALFSEVLPIVPLDAGPYFKLFSPGIRMSALLRALPADFLERGLPRRGPPDPAVLVGFGRWLAWAWRSGKSLPLAVSRLVLRYAFNGRLRADDFADVDAEFAAAGPTDAEMRHWIAPLRNQLDAIRAGAAAAGSPPDDALLPRVFQLRPLRPIAGVAPAVAPLVREAEWPRQRGKE